MSPGSKPTSGSRSIRARSARRSARPRRTRPRMQIEPAADAFGQTYAAGRAQVVWTTLVADLETPVSAFLKLATRRPLSFLLESVEGGATRGRYSVIGLDPDVVWRGGGARARSNHHAPPHHNA